MLPWVYNADAGGNTSRNDRTNSGYANDICNSEGYLKDYYQQYENDQKKMYDMQMDALKKKQANKNSRSRSGSRNRQRSRSRSRGRYRSRSRDRRRSRSRERRYRGRSRTRSRSRSPRRYGRRSRSRSPCRDSAPVPPSNKLALMNLPKDITRDLIASILASTGFHPMDIRVIHKNSERGAARSFGFIDFPDVATAIRWMDTTKGRLTLPDGRWISVHYSKPETTVPGGRPSGDWICASCTVMNFVKRDVCHKCDTSRTQSDEMERQGVHMIGVSPCDTLLIRDLPHAVTTTDIFNGLVKNTPLKSIIQLQLSESKLFAYIQMKSIDEATVLFDSSYKAPIQVLDKNVIMTYCRVPLSHMMRGNQTSGYDPKLAVDWTSAQTSSSGAEVAAAAMMRVHQRQTPSSQATPQNLYVPSTGAMTYPPPVVNSNYSVPPPTVSYGFGIDTSVPPPTAAKAAQQPPPPVKNGIVGIVPTPRGVMPQYVIPNPSTFQYEPTTGYFLDPITHFYYDAKTTYYYNSDTRQWMYYDSTYSTYFQAQEEESTAPAAENVVQDIIKPDDPKLDDSKKSASDIAKEMHKWAKKQEKQKLQITMKPLVKPLETKSAFDSMASCSTSGADPATILDKSKNPLGSMSDDSDEDDSYKKQSSNEKIEVPPPMNVGISGSYVEPTRQRALPSAEEQREMMERALIDEAKKMCLLCKRAFPSVDVLRKHVEKSDLHKKNLDEKRVEWGQQYMASIKSMGEEKLHVPEPAPKMVYRDRAKERRKQFGIDGGYGRDVTPGATKTEEEIRKESEEAIRRPIDSSNIGNKLLKNMGWKEGQGAGKFGQGIVNPIEAERRVEGAGLGSSGSRIAHGAEASHRERVRASFFNRYKEMQ